MEYLDKIYEFADKHPFTVAFMFIGFSIGYIIDSKNKKEETPVLYLNNKEV